MIILAIDQGATKTQALVADEQGHILGTGLDRGACHFMDGMGKAMFAVQGAADKAIEQAGIKKEDVCRVSGGLAGANWPDEIENLEKNLEKIYIGAKVSVCNDCVPALYAGTTCANAVILCAGTHFNAAVLKNRELVWIYNNYTESIDQGGRSLAIRAMEGVLRSVTCMGPETSLKQRAMDFFGYDEILPMVLDFSRGNIRTPLKDFVKTVDEEAMRGDKVALDAQYEFARSLSRYAIGALKKYELIGTETDIVLSGGVFKAQSPVMVDAISTEVHRVSPTARIVEAVYEPVVGALELALDRNNKEIWWPNIVKSAKEHDLIRC